MHRQKGSRILKLIARLYITERSSRNCQSRWSQLSIISRSSSPLQKYKSPLFFKKLEKSEIHYPSIFLDLWLIAQTTIYIGLCRKYVRVINTYELSFKVRYRLVIHTVVTRQEQRLALHISMIMLRQKRSEKLQSGTSIAERTFGTTNASCTIYK